jgi:NTP pyrophosphatase (non-canonical NTP hydrolase)
MTGILSPYYYLHWWGLGKGWWVEAVWYYTDRDGRMYSVGGGQVESAYYKTWESAQTALREWQGGKHTPSESRSGGIPTKAVEELEKYLYPEERENLFPEIMQERDRQERLHPNFPADNYDRQISILLEEVGEAAREVVEAGVGRVPVPNFRQEMVEVAAFSIRMIQNYDEEMERTE